MCGSHHHGGTRRPARRIPADDLRVVDSNPGYEFPGERARRKLREHVSDYVQVMALLVVIWALTGAAYFWPVWPMLGWGIGVLSHARSVRPIGLFGTPIRR